MRVTFPVHLIFLDVMCLVICDIEKCQCQMTLYSRDLLGKLIVGQLFQKCPHFV